MKIPRLFLDLAGLDFEEKIILRVISMDSETDDLTVLITNNVTKQDYKIILSVGKALNLLGYFKDEIKTIIEEKKDVTIKKQVVVKDEKGE